MMPFASPTGVAATRRNTSQFTGHGPYRRPGDRTTVLQNSPKRRLT